MEWLNYHHLFYFWMVAREGSIAAASQRLLLAPPTISAQLRSLEKALEQTLMTRSGRSLVPTEAGREVLRYADEIFALGREMVDSLRGQSQRSNIRINVGVNDVLPKLVVYRLLEPLLREPESSRIRCIQGTPMQLVPALVMHDLDVVLTDGPIGSQLKVRAFSHLLGSCGVTLFAAPALARKYKKGFPKSLDGAPVLLPDQESPLRLALDGWFETIGVRPEVVGEFEDVALLNEFGEQGQGFFAGYDVVAEETQSRYRVLPIGAVAGLRQRFFAVSVERRITHPAIAQIVGNAREKLFG